MGDVVHGELAEFAHDPHACVVGAELDCMKGAEGGEAGHELQECVLHSIVSIIAQRGEEERTMKGKVDGKGSPSSESQSYKPVLPMIARVRREVWRSLHSSPIHYQNRSGSSIPLR